MLYVSAAYAVMRCLSVCLRNLAKRIFKFFYRRVATPFLFFNTKRHGNIPTGTPERGRRLHVG